MQRSGLIGAVFGVSCRARWFWVKQFDVLNDPTAVTRGPVDERVQA